MEEDSRQGPLKDGCAQLHAPNFPETAAKVTPNGHSISSNKGNECKKRVDPLRIRIGTKFHEILGKTLKPQIISNVQNKDTMPTKTTHNTGPHITHKTGKISPKSDFGGFNSDPHMKKNVPPKKMKPSKQNSQSLGLQPTVKFKCRKCSSMSFKSLVMLKEHQRLCKALTGSGEEDKNPTNTSAASGRVTKKVYLCSSCSNYYESWNLFLHMRQIHNRHICLYCLGMFSKAERLTSHLFLKHGVAEQNFKTKDEFESTFGGTLILTCCVCDELYTEKDNYLMHNCVGHAPVTTQDKSNEDVSVALASDSNVDSNGVEEILPSIDKLDPAPIKTEESSKESLVTNVSPVHLADNSLVISNKHHEISEKENLDTLDVTKEEPPLNNSNNSISKIEDGEVSAVQKDPNNSTYQESESISSDMDDSSSLCLDPPKHENNNITEKVKEVGIKLKLSLNSASSPVIINSTVQPEQKPKPLVRPNRPPGGRIIAPGEPFPPPSLIHANVPTTIYDNKSEEVNTMNKVPKLTVRVPKGLLDKDTSSEESSDSEVSDKLTVDDTVVPDNTEINSETPNIPIDDVKLTEQSISQETVTDTNTDTSNKLSPDNDEPVKEEIPPTEISLDRPLDKYPLKELLKVCVLGTMYYCVYCNHVRKIAVNCKQLALHMLETHRFSATVNSITAEELLPETIKQKLRTDLDEGQCVYINLDTYDSVDPVKLLPHVRTYECFQCYYTTTVHKDLYFHNRKMHQKTILFCVMCKSNFYSYSELLCHRCPGTFDPEHEMKFRCCLCNIDNIPSAFRLMVHMRKIHHACDVCTEICESQSQLNTHVWKHKLHHFCYRCGIAYRNKADINNHLFWKHGTESVSCKKCLEKKWPHMYHFCVPRNTFLCDECNETFTTAVCLKVHKRFHSETYPHVCSEDGCNEKFVSKKLLLKHMDTHIVEITEEPTNDQKDMEICENKEEIKNVLPDDETKDKTADIDDVNKVEPESLKKIKKKKNKDKDSFLLDVNLPVLNLSESDSDESDSTPITTKVEEEINDSKIPKESDDSKTPKETDDSKTPKETDDSKTPKETDDSKTSKETDDADKIQLSDLILDPKPEEKEIDQQALDIWDNFKQYQAKIEKQKVPLTVIRKHVCESDHDYCLVPNDTNGDILNDISDKQKNKSPKKKVNKINTGSSSSSSSSSSSDSCCSRGSKCSCSSSSRSSSSSSSDSDSSTSLRDNRRKITKTRNRRRRDSNGSHSSVDVMAVEEQPPLVPEKKPSPIPETDLETDESDSDEEFYDKNPQQLGSKLRAEKSLLTSAAPSETGSIAGDFSRPITPEKTRSPKKKRKTKKRKKSGKIKREPIKLNIPKDVIGQSGQTLNSIHNPHKITISLHSNSFGIPSVSKPNTSTPLSLNQENKRASKRRRVPNKFYGYSSDEETVPKLQPVIRNEWKKKEDYSSNAFAARPQPSFSHKIPNYNEPLMRMSTPVPDPVPPPILMNTENADSTDTSSDEYELRIDHPNMGQNAIAVPSPHMASSGSSYLPGPAGARQAREGESVYCYCRCPYDEVSEMIACDAIGCAIEWFHFECVGIMVPPKGKWFCPDCRQRQGML